MPGLTGSLELFAAPPTLFAPAAGHAVIGLAVSGGADSLALMLLAREWAAGMPKPPKLIVYSVDHGLRPEAADEAAFVTREAQRLGLAARVLRWDGAKPAAGVQAAARQARYRLMGDAMRADGAELLLTAHHQQDQAETVLMRLAHGSGLEGLRGMDPLGMVEGVPVFRPLLAIAPEALRAVVAEAGIVPVADPSNADHHYERVRWRQLAPTLADAGLDAATLSHFARRAGEADAALSLWAGQQFDALVEIDQLGAASLSRAALLALPRAVGVKLLARLLEVVGGGQRPRALGIVERLHDRLARNGGDAGPDAARCQRSGARRRRLGQSRTRPAADGRGHPLAGRLPAVGSPVPHLQPLRRCLERAYGAGIFTPRRRAIGRAIAAGSGRGDRGAPLVSGSDGAPLALGGYCLGGGVEVQFDPGAVRLPEA